MVTQRKIQVTFILGKGLDIEKGDAGLECGYEDKLLSQMKTELEKHFQNHRTGRLKTYVRLRLVLEGLDVIKLKKK